MQKPVDERICQEINQRIAQNSKNCWEAVYQINQRLDMIASSVERIENSQNEKIAALESRIKEMEIVSENLEKDVSRQWRKMADRLDMFDNEIKRYGGVVNHFTALIHDLYAVHERFTITDQILAKRIDIMEKKGDRFDTLLALNLQATSAHTKQYLHDFRDEIEARIPSMEPIKQHVAQKMDEIQVTMDGFKRELQLVKNDVDYGEKKFENIYTLIKRLSAPRDE